MKNKLIDLNNHLFEQIERLGDEDISDEELEKEVIRSKAMTTVAQTIINNASLVLKAKQHNDEYNNPKSEHGELFKLVENKEKYFKE